MKISIGTGLAAATLALIIAGTADAGWADGTWLCHANGNVAIGTLTIRGGDYSFVVTRSVDFRVPKPEDRGNGSGRLTFDGNVFMPSSGPLKTAYKVNGARYAEGLALNNDDGALMRCQIRS